jgi:hypothetical protein
LIDTFQDTFADTLDDYLDHTFDDVLETGQTVDWSGLPCEGRFWDWKLGAAKAHYL